MLKPEPVVSDSVCEILARAIIQRLRAKGHQAYLVGGCVRDRLLGIAPKDFDISTDALPGEIVREFPGSSQVGAHFGVVLVCERLPDMDEEAQVEVATFRSETTYSDGRRPDRVSFETNPALDAQRRDFTINGLFEDPFSGQILDFVGGRGDLAAKVVRAIGDPDQRFAEDHLRLLRAVRFAARFGFSIEAQTLAAMRRQAPSVATVSAERIRDELARILTEGAARRGFELLESAGLLVHILPEVKAFQGVEQPPEFHPEGDVWAHLLLMLDHMREPTLTLALGVLLHDVGKPPTFRIADRIRFDSHASVGAAMAHDLLSRLRFSNEQIEQATALVAHHMTFKDLPNMRLSTLKRFLRQPCFNEHLELHRLDCLASNGRTDSYEFALSKLVELQQEDLHPAPLLTGKDLIAAGYPPGPSFGEALAAVETAQLEGEIQTRDQALALARTVLARAVA